MNNQIESEQFRKKKMPFYNSVINALEQGSQTQMDSGAAWDSKQDLAGRIAKMKKKINFVFLINLLEKYTKIS